MSLLLCTVHFHSFDKFHFIFDNYLALYFSELEANILIKSSIFVYFRKHNSFSGLKETQETMSTRSLYTQVTKPECPGHSSPKIFLKETAGTCG